MEGCKTKINQWIGDSIRILPTRPILLLSALAPDRNPLRLTSPTTGGVSYGDNTVFGNTEGVYIDDFGSLGVFEGDSVRPQPQI